MSNSEDNKAKIGANLTDVTLPQNMDGEVIVHEINKQAQEMTLEAVLSRQRARRKYKFRGYKNLFSK